MKLKQMLAIGLTLLGLFLGREASAFYDPTIGRWVSRDPIEEDGGRNVYSYVNGNGIGFIDKLGREPWPQESGPPGTQQPSPTSPTPADPPAPDIPAGKQLKDFNCAGLALNTFTFGTPTDVQTELAKRNCQVISCSTTCAAGKTKVWVWNWLYSAYVQRPSGFWDRVREEKNFHIVSHPCECNKCYAKTHEGPIRGPLDPASERPKSLELETINGVTVKRVRDVQEVCFSCDSK